VYGTAGGTVEKGVSLVEKIYSYNAQNIAMNSDYYSTTIHGFQYSLDGNIGANYKVYKSFSGYIETGIAYFIPSNQPESYRTVHPFGVTIKVGIRFTFGKN
jgi:RNA polymerase sigma-70 factor (ECF subfamily)